ncbi:hypothetical protein F3Y22_tig00111388pilonHSYRG00164 [Hibiscus syriacus]|uniref:GTP cyclohydrolase II domain-containing protein n=1 Tax=Hibiscus syriacus TaxID=106335 RepID=A0A6A2YMB2_HIBSY|nr:hypothetical protein F3Y22_tig00111388pilonHSYRG00164 [Hibiscus syriacus]
MEPCWVHLMMMRSSAKLEHWMLKSPLKPSISLLAMPKATLPFEGIRFHRAGIEYNPPRKGKTHHGSFSFDSGADGFHGKAWLRHCFVGMKEEDLERLKLPLMSPEIEDGDSSPPFTITVDAKTDTRPEFRLRIGQRLFLHFHPRMLNLMNSEDQVPENREKTIERTAIFVSAYEMGEQRDGQDVLVRVHSECLTGDIFGSARCDCGNQLDLAMQLIEQASRGVMVYLEVMKVEGSD